MHEAKHEHRCEVETASSYAKCNAVAVIHWRHEAVTPHLDGFESEPVCWQKGESLRSRIGLGERMPATQNGH